MKDRASEAGFSAGGFPAPQAEAVCLGNLRARYGIGFARQCIGTAGEFDNKLCQIWKNLKIKAV